MYVAVPHPPPAVDDSDRLLPLHKPTDDVVSAPKDGCALIATVTGVAEVSLVAVLVQPTFIWK